MSNFSKHFTETFDFDDDRVMVKFKSLSRQAALEVAPFFTEDDDGLKMAFVDYLKFAEAASKILPEHVISFHGLFIDGQEVTRSSDEFTDCVLGDMYFSSLVSDMLTTLVSSSTLVKADEGKSEGPSGDTSAAINGMANSG